MIFLFSPLQDVNRKYLESQDFEQVPTTFSNVVLGSLGRSKSGRRVQDSNL